MCFENVPCKVLYSEKMGFGMAPRRCEIHSKLQPLLQKTCLLYVSAYTEVCLRMHALDHVCKLLPTYMGRGPLWSFIFKNRFLLI